MHIFYRRAPASPASARKPSIVACLPLPLSVAIACIYPCTALALPQNPTVAAGAVNISTSDGAMQINQTTSKAIIDWQKFGIAFNESVKFNQPSRSSVVLNRVRGAESSALDGALNATGQVFIVNPNGVLISSSARVSAGGLLATTLDIENQRFLNSEYKFTAKSGTDRAPVANAGAITAVDGGYVVMLANNVRNNGTIDAPSGHVLMGAGSQATLYISDQSLLGYRIDAGSAAALVENLTTIRANGGQVTLAAHGLSGASQLASAAVNNSGIIEAKTLNGHAGAIVLSADMASGRVSVTGKLDASAQTGAGGTIDTSGAVVSIGDNASISTDSLSGATGLWTITSVKPVIGTIPGAISNTTLGSTLDRSNVSINAVGNGSGDLAVLSVNGEIAALGKNKLVLKSENNLLINAPVSVGSGGLLAHADTKGTGKGKVIVATDTRIQASNGAPIDIYTNVANFKDTGGYDGFITSPYRLWMLVNNVRQLQDMEKNLSGNYALGRDIDAAETASWNGNAGFRPIGLDTRRFNGQLDGMNHVISSLTINRPRNDFIGLFSELSGTVRNVGLQDIHLVANSHAGAFAGYNGGTLSNVYATGAVSVDVEAGYSEQATDTAGGLVGSNGKSGSIRDAYSLVNVGGRAVLGGIAGTNEGVIDSVYAAGTVGRGNLRDDLFQIGGLVGNNRGQVRNAYWTSDGTGKNLALGTDAAPAGMQNSSTMLTNDSLRTADLGLNFDTVWFRYDGYTAPLLRSFLKPLEVSRISREIDKVYDGVAFDYQSGLLYSNPDAALSRHLNSSSVANVGDQGQDVGTYTSRTATTFWSDQQGYLIKTPVIKQSTTVAISARPITVEANADTKSFDSSDSSSVVPGVCDIKNELNLGLANGNTLDASQLFDSTGVGDRTLTIASFAIKDSAGKDVTSNYQVSKKNANGKIVTVKPDPTPDPNPNPNPGPKPNPNPEPNPNPNPGPNPAPGTNPPTDGSGNGGQGGTGVPGGSTGGKTPSPSDSAGGQPGLAPLFAYIATQDEDELMKKSMRNRNIRNDATLSIRDGGIQLPDNRIESE